MQETHSQLQVYSLGIAAANKHLETDLLYVNPIEITSFGDGELDARLENYEGTGSDKDGGSYNVKVQHTAAVEAKWLRIGHTNRRTSPDVRRGERVILYRHSDSSDLYWDTMGMDDHLRRLETVIWSWSDIREENKDATDPANNYSFELCTHTKQATFKTVKADQEPFEYRFQFNTKEGVVILTDDVGNFFELNSAKSYVKMHNKDNATYVLDRENADMFAPGSMAVKAEKDISFKCNRFTVEAGNNISVYAGQHICYDAKDTITHHTREMNMYYDTMDATDDKGNGMTSGSKDGIGYVHIKNENGSYAVLEGAKAEMSAPSYNGSTVSMEGIMDEEKALWYTFGEPMDKHGDEIRATHSGGNGTSDIFDSKLHLMNRVHIDGDAHYIEILNIDQTHIELDKEDMRITVPNNLTINVGNKFTINSEKESDINVTEGLTLHSGEAYVRVTAGDIPKELAAGVSLKAGKHIFDVITGDIDNDGTVDMVQYQFDFDGNEDFTDLVKEGISAYRGKPS